ncbi:PH domain-containing protein [Litchfieldia alkalitelluris]|uniref:PH domain-containing protein n=1 Tax=Litchfieldia alkalitelluris TaxID=304268 RepID=UPI0014744116|nr:PH domain-containing protein [Litchfieldia alkalitelluris]
MSKPRRMHPYAAVITFIQRIRELLFPLVLFIFIGGRGENPLVDLLQVVGLALILVGIVTSGILHWYRFTYRIEDDELRIEYGVFVRKKRYIPIERIQTINVTSGVIQRLFKLVKLQVETAGGGAEAEAVLTAITQTEADRLQECLTKVNKEHHHQEKQEQSTNTYQMNQKELFIAATTSGGIGIVFSGLIAFFSQVDEIIPYDLIFEGIEDYLKINMVVYFVLISILLLLVAWLVGMLIVVLRYANFSVEKSGDELIITRGLLERRRLTVPIKRIQAIKMVENPVRQILGYTTVYLESAGGSAGDKEDGFSTMLFPLLKKNQLEHALGLFVSDYQADTVFTTPPKKALIRYVLRAVFPVVVVITPLIYFLGNWTYWSLLLVPISFILGYKRYSDAGYHLGEETKQIGLRFRLFSRVTVLIKKRRVQALQEQQSLFQKQSSLATIQASILSSGTGRSFKVLDIAEEDSLAIFKWYSRSSKSEG